MTRPGQENPPPTTTVQASTTSNWDASRPTDQSVIDALRIAHQAAAAANTSRERVIIDSFISTLLDPKLLDFAYVT